MPYEREPVNVIPIEPGRSVAGEGWPTPERRTDVLIVGAGPYGLALAAQARHLGLDHVVLGQPMGFWRANMPAGMYLRSGCDWHLDPVGVDTMAAYLAEQGLTPAETEPISRDRYLAYTAWFQRRKGIAPVEDTVVGLDRSADGGFHAALAGGGTIAARRVVLALGFGAFEYVPADLATLLPPERFGHTRDEVALGAHRGQRCLILGGRQSAYEWAALLREAGAEEVHIVHRHPSPAFAEADWSWVTPLMDTMEEEPGWYRALPPVEQEAIVRQLFAEGRLKIEPWLRPRVLRDGIHRWPSIRLASCRETAAGDLAVALDDGTRLVVDHVILATGYRVRMDRVPFLATGNVLPGLAQRDGYPVLSDHFETSVPGLFVTSMPAVRDFGPFFAFTVAVRAAARIIGNHLAAERGAA